MRTRAAIVLDLILDAEGAARLDALADRFEQATAFVLKQPILADTHNVVVLQRALYGTLKSDFGLPAQYILLCLRLAAALHHRGVAAAEPGLVPVDAKTVAVRGADAVSIATLDGRLVTTAVFRDYDPEFGALSGAGALIRDASGWSVRLHVDLPRAVAEMIERRKVGMESILGRVGRLITGMTHAAIGAAEGAATPAVLEQNIREVDRAMADLRKEMGTLEAERTRLEGRGARPGSRSRRAGG